MAEQNWDAPDLIEDEQTGAEDTVPNAMEPVDERMQGAEIVLSFSKAAVVHSTSPSQSVSTDAAPAVPVAPVAPVAPIAPAAPAATAPTLISTPPIRDSSMAALTPQQRTVQQQRKAMTPTQRGALALKPYTHYDFNNIQIGTLWQTKNENRTFRQTQRRKGAARLRAGTTTGLKFPGRRRAWAFVTLIWDILTTKNAFPFVFSSQHLFFLLSSSSSIIVFKTPWITPREKNSTKRPRTMESSSESNNGFVQRVSSCGELANYTQFSHPTPLSRTTAWTRRNNTMERHGALPPDGSWPYKISFSVLLSVPRNNTTTTHNMSSSWEDQSMDDRNQHQLFYSDDKAQRDDSMTVYPSGPTFVQSRLPDSASYHNFNACESFMALEDPFSDGFVPICGDIPMNDFAHDPCSQPSEPDYPNNNYFFSSLDDFEDALFSPGNPQVVEISQIPVDSIEFPSTPASVLPAPAPNVQQIKTPCKSNKKTRKPNTGKQNIGKKKFPCPYAGCRRVSTCATNLEEHILTHTGVKEYACEICTASFGRPWGLHRHYETKHHMDVKVEKKRGARNRVDTGSPKKSGKTGGMDDQHPLPQGPPPSVLPPQAPSPQGPYTPPPTSIRITARGPEGPFSCCFEEFADGNDFVIHNHLYHGLLYSFLCSCNICQNDQVLIDQPVQQHPTWNKHPMDVGSEDEDMSIDSTLHTPVTRTDRLTSSPTSITSSTSSMATDSPIYSPSESLPDVDMHTDTEMDGPIYDTMTFDSDHFPVHNHGPVSPSTFYADLGIDYDGMSNEQLYDYFGDNWA
jgi:hypothetical protein